MKLGMAGRRGSGYAGSESAPPRDRGERRTRGFNGGDVLFFYSFFFYKKAFIQVQKDAWLKSRALCIKKIVCISWRRMYVSPETRQRPLCNPDRSFRRR